MNLKLPTRIASSLVLIIVLAASAAAQQKRQTPLRTQPQAAATPAPTPPPTFDTLLAADIFRIYGEVRSVGQLIRSNSVNEILEPILKLAGPADEFRTVVKWLNTHADEVMSSRLLFAAWSSGNELPEALVAIEFSSPEEASKFQQQLNRFLKKMMPPAVNSSGEPGKPQPAPLPPYHMRRAGSLILITPKPVDLQKLRPAGSKLLSEDVNFRIARNRLNTESIFFFVDYAGIQKEEAERLKRSEELHQKVLAEQAANAEAAEPNVEPQTEPEESEPPIPETPEIVGVETELKATPPSQELSEQQRSATEMLVTLSMVLSSFSGVDPKWPAAFGVGLSLEGDSFDVRALLVNAPGEKSDPLPFLPVLTPGPAIVPEAPNILPADTEMFVAMSLDLPQMYALLTRSQPMLPKHGTDMKIEEVGEIEPPFAALERQLKIQIKDDLLPLIGPEIVVSVPMSGFGWFEPPQAGPTPPASPVPSASPAVLSSPGDQSSYSVGVTVKDATTDPKTGRSVAIALSLKDKEAMRALLPKLVESVAFKGASALAQTERREDTELVSYANVVSYAFIGNFLVVSPDVATVRHIVDSYLKRETLSGEPHFKNYTRWQPRQLQGQVYISPSLMESYRTWIQQPGAVVDDQTRAFLTQFSVVAQPVTYSLSNEGFGPMHELHLPKNLVLFIIAASAGGTKAAPPQADMPSTAPPNP